MGATPSRITRPWFAVNSIPWRIKDVTPVASIVIVVPAWVILRTSSIRSTKEVSMPWVAPRLLAISIRAGTRSIAIIVSHPLTFAAYTACWCFECGRSYRSLATDHDSCKPYATQANYRNFIIWLRSCEVGNSACTSLLMLKSQSSIFA